MTTRADIRSRIRTELNDTAVGNYLYPDTLLNYYMDEAIREWSFRYPPVRTATVTPVNGQRNYNLSFEVQHLVKVEQPESVLLPQGNVAVEVYNSFKPYVQAWEYTKYRQLSLRYNSITGDQDLLITYYGYYLVPTDDVTTLDLEIADEWGLVWFVCGRALQWLETQRGQRGDSKHLPRTKVYGDRYQAVFKAALRRKGIFSYRLQREV